ncbi:hypothetical protein AVEN_65293-1 [Araneus ventricosus]|uniref:C2H2-type domain-containing protein n=1 Tax=Araneus ventricosus TaxID=182803 RepID=A0A4Y2AHH7_ARAVE|nr:hypothetical protein AVEN_65293-1 [Araneus ventricosus]
MNGSGSVKMTKTNTIVEVAPSEVSTFCSTESIPMLYSMVVKKKIVQNALCDEVPANTFCLSASNEQFDYSVEFPALPSNNAFLSLPTIDSVCFTSPAYSFVSTLTKPVSSLSQPLLSKTVSSASLQFPLPQCSRPIISQNLSKLVPSLPVPATESELSSTFPKPLLQRSCFITSSQAPLSNLIPSLSPDAAESELSSTTFKPLPQRSCFITASQSPFSNLIPSLSPHAAESELSSTTFKPLPQRSRPITTQAPLSELIPSSSPLTTESELPSKPLFSCLMPSLSVPAAKSKVSSAFSKPLPRHSHRQSRSLSVFSNQMFNIKVSNSFGILENMSELENPVDSLLKGVCTGKNGGGAISKICKVCQDSFPSYYLYKKHVQSSNCSLALSDSRKITYPRKCDKCFSTYATKSSFSNHKRSCSKKLELSNVVNDSSSIADSSSSSKLALSYPIYACNVCSKTFSTKFSLNRHEEICSNPTEPLYPRMCEKCRRFFKDRNSFYRHKKNCTMNKNSVIHYCPFPSCTSSFSYLSYLNKHMLSEHQLDEVKQYVFDSMSSFQTWLEQESASTFSSFRKYSGTRKEPSKSFHYYCCNFFNQNRTLGQPRKTVRKNIKGTIPAHINCPVRICACEQSDKVEVTYYSVHNHYTGVENLKYLQLKQSTRDVIKTYLSFSVPIPKIQKMLRGELGSRDKRNFFPIKEAFVSRKVIQAYLRSSDNSMFPKDDSTSVVSIVECLRKEPYDPILIFKLQNSTTLYGPSDLDYLPTSQTSFALGFQTEHQRDMLVRNSDKVLCIDSTHKTNQYDFYLINLIVPDNYGKGCPVAHFITNYLDINTMICLFSRLKVKIPGLNVNCIMTDDDQNTFEAFNVVFGPNIRHLLCKWHVFRSWSRQLYAKVSNKQLVKEMKVRLKELLNVKERDAFEKLLAEFENIHFTKSPEFVDYFKKHYCNRVQLWSASYRNFPHASTETNNYCESFHNQLKTVYFQRKFNRRIDRLIRTVLDMETESYLSYKYKEINHMPFKTHSNRYIKDRHAKSREIVDNDVIQLTSTSWLVRSQSKEVEYSVTQINDICPSSDFCFIKCLEVSCMGLCSHLYQCNCQDLKSNNLCKHIHKIHSQKMKGKITFQSDNFQVEESFSNVDSESDYNVGHTSQFEQGKSPIPNLCFELLELMKNEKVQSVMSSNVETVLRNLISGCRGVMNSSVSEKIDPIVPCLKIHPNQKLIPQTDFFKTNNKHTKQNTQKKISSKRKLEDDVDDPDSQPIKKYKFSKNKSFSTSLKYTSKPIEKVGIYNVTYGDLKSLDPFLPEDEILLIKSKFPDFVCGWLYDVVIDAFLYKLCSMQTTFTFIDSSVSQLLHGGNFK